MLQYIGFYSLSYRITFCKCNESQVVMFFHETVLVYTTHKKFYSKISKILLKIFFSEVVVPTDYLVKQVEENYFVYCFEYSSV